jgi:hypothetical protein
MIKGKFESAPRSKSYAGQINEVLCKVLCHNICVLAQATHELQRFVVKLNHNTVSTLALAQEVFSEEKHVAGSEGGSITVQTAIGVELAF